MKKYTYLVYVDYGYYGDYVREEDTKAFDSLDDAEAYRDYLQPKNKYSDVVDVVITKVVEDVTP